MSRNTGTFNFAANFEGLLKAPIDARQLVETLADLTGATTWNASGNVWLYDGAIVSVSNDPDPLNNGIYFLDDADNYDNINSWVKAGEGGSGTITGGTNGLSTDGANIVLGGELLSGTTITIATGTTLTIEDLRGTPLGIQYAANYDSGFTPRSLVDKEYVDSVATGLDPKLAVEVATSPADGNIDLTGGTFSGGSTIDGIIVQDGWRVLIKNQTSEQFNGIWIFSGSSDTFYRSEDFDEDSEVIQGALIPVITGNTNKNTLWVLVTPNPIILDTTPLEFSLFSSPIVTAGLGIDISGVTISVDGSVLAGDGIIWDNNEFNVSASNGLSVDSSNVKLGGGLTEATIISGNSQSLCIGTTTSKLQNLNVCANSLSMSSISGVGLGFTDEFLFGSTGSVSGGSFGFNFNCDQNFSKIYGGCGVNITCFVISGISLGEYEMQFVIPSGQTVGAKIYDNRTISSGFEYANSYHNNYVDRSLVDKEYVDLAISGATSGITGTITGATNGLSVYGGDIGLGGTLTGDTTISSTGNSLTLGSTSNKLTCLHSNTNQGVCFYDDSTISTSRLALLSGIVILATDDYNILMSCSDSTMKIGYSILDNYFGWSGTTASDSEMLFNIVSGNTKGARFIDNRTTPRGIEYNADYGASFVARSLVDAAYVTGLTTTSGIQTANNGLTKIGTNVVLGGTLTGNTCINIGSSNFRIGESSYCNIFIGGGNTIIGDITDGNFIQVQDGGQIDISAKSGSNITQTFITASAITITNTFSGFTGAQYNSDYSANFVARSLPDVDYLTGYTQSAITTNSNVINIVDFTGTGYTATTESDFIGASGGTTIYLPNPPKNGQRIIVADIEGNAVSENIIINGNGNSIEGVSTATINTDYGSITFIFNTKGFWSTTAFIN